MHHPSENVGIEFSARGLAGLFGRDRAQQPELRMWAKILKLLSHRSFAEIDVLVPASHAERNALVQLFLARVDAVRVHNPDQLVPTVRRLSVKQRGRLRRLEMLPRLQSVLIIGEVILGLRNIREKNLIPVGQRLAVILVGQPSPPSRRQRWRRPSVCRRDLAA